MKKIKVTLLFALILISFAAMAQTSTETTPYIEINGTAEIEIDPDQIFINITLEENTDKSKKDITEQEQDLIKALQSVGIEASKLAVTDANAYYGKSGFMSKDVVNRKLLELEVKDATQAKKAFEQMDKINIKNAYIARVDHSKMEDYKKEAKIKAIKSAKEKASYLLAAIDENLGNALIVRENINNVYGNQIMANARSTMSYELAADYSGATPDVNLDFKKITITASVYVKWEISDKH